MMRAERTPPQCRIWFGGVLLAVTVASCVGPGEFLRRPKQPLTWPPRAEAARIGHVLSYHGNDDVVRHPGFFTSLFQLLVGETRTELIAPNGAVTTADDMLWIADSAGEVIHRLSLASGEHLVLRGTAEQPLRTPVGIAAVPDGRVFVTDSASGKVVAVSPSGEFLASFGGPEELGRPTGIVYDASRDRLLVLDTTGCRILAYSLDGRRLASAGSRGKKPGQFNYPTNLAVGKDGRILVTDSLNFRIQVLDPEFRPLSEFGMVGRGPGTFASPKGVAVDSKGHIYVVDALFDNVQIFDSSGRLLLRFGERGSGLGQFYLPTGIHIDAQDRIIVSDRGNGRIQIFRYLRNLP